MNTNIRNIGNSQGVIIPAAILSQLGIEGQVDMRVEGSRIILEAVKRHPRDGWEEAILKDPPSDNEPVFMDGIEDDDTMVDWTW